MKILFILPYIPYPLNSGGNQATYNMINKIKESYNVSLLLRVETESDEQAISSLQERWKDVCFFLYRPQNTQKEASAIETYPKTFSFRFFDAIRRSMERKTTRRIRKYRQKITKTQDDTCDLIRQSSCLNKDTLNIPTGYLNYVYKISRQGFDLIQVEFYDACHWSYILPETAIKCICPA